MASLTFWQQFALMIVDKLAIGIVIVIVALIGQRIIETYKGRQALWTEISKQRVKHIACEWNEMNKWDAIVGKLYAKLQHILESELDSQTRLNDRAKTALPELSETIAFLSGLNLESISGGLTEQCKQELSPLIEESVQQSAVVGVALQANRFWMGDELYKHCRRFQRTLYHICVSFGAMDFRKLAEQAKELTDCREDVLTTLKRLK